MCPLSERLKTSNEQVLSVLDHLEITSPISLLSHSGGFYYALDLLKTNLDLFHPNPRLVASSPWVPCSCSNSKLSLIPTFLVRGAVKGVSTLGPGISRLVDGLGGWSSGVSSSIGLSSPTLSTQAKADEDSRTKSKSQKKYPKAYFHPPYTPPSKANDSLSLDSFKEAASHPSTGRVIDNERSGGVKLLQEFIAVEGTEGIGEDLLFCLGRAEGGDKRLIEILNDTLTEFERNQKRFDATIVWANEDGLVSHYRERLSRNVRIFVDILILLLFCLQQIPLKGRNWLSKIITDSPAVDETILEMAPPAAHDDPLMSEEVLSTLMRCLKGEKVD